MIIYVEWINKLAGQMPRMILHMDWLYLWSGEEVERKNIEGNVKLARL